VTPPDPPSAADPHQRGRPSTVTPEAFPVIE